MRPVSLSRPCVIHPIRSTVAVVDCVTSEATSGTVVVAHDVAVPDAVKHKATTLIYLHRVPSAAGN